MMRGPKPEKVTKIVFDSKHEIKRGSSTLSEAPLLMVEGGIFDYDTKLENARRYFKQSRAVFDK